MPALAPDSLVPTLNERFAEGRIAIAPTVRHYLRVLEEAKWIDGVARSPRDPSSHWRLSTSLRGRWHLSPKPSAG
jgi:hypothetical protein